MHRFLAALCTLVLLAAEAPAQTYTSVTPTKALPRTVFSAITNTTSTSSALDWTQFDAAIVSVTCSGTCTTQIVTQASQTQTGTFVTVKDPNATRTLTASGTTVYTVSNLQSWIRFVATVPGPDTITLTVVGRPLAAPVWGRAETTVPSTVSDGDPVLNFLTTEGAQVIAGHDGVNPQKLLTDTSGNLQVDLAGVPAGTLDTNIAQVAGATVAAGNGASTAATLRVAQVSDGTGTLATVSTVTNVATIGTSVTPGTSATHLGKAEDNPHASGDTAVPAWGVRNDNLGTTFGADQDYSPIAVTSTGAVIVSGGTASDLPVVGNPLHGGGRAETTAPTAVSDGDAVALFLTTTGAQVAAGFDGTNPQTIKTDSGGAVQVDVEAALPAGTNNIGDVDVEIMGTAATVDASATGQTSDFTIEAATANLRILGWTVREDAGTPAVATVVIRHDADGTCDNSAVVAFIELAANGSAGESYSDRGLAVANGLCADVLAGSVSLGVFTVVEAAP